MGGLIFPVWVYLEVVAWRAQRRRTRAAAAAPVAVRPRPRCVCSVCRPVAA